jgi:hypothetical protein
MGVMLAILIDSGDKHYAAFGLLAVYWAMGVLQCELLIVATSRRGKVIRWR